MAGCAGAYPSAAPRPATSTEPAVGVLVMAHGGSAIWNEAVHDAVGPLARDFPVEIALGMADSVSLQQGVTALENRGVVRIAVVRLFISGHSFREQTEYLLGLRSAPPASWAGHSGAGHGAGTRPVGRRADLLISAHGIAESPVVGAILRQRVARLSVDPRNESVLVLAHGMGNEDENGDVLRAMDLVLDSIRTLGPFRSVRGETLREDWPTERQAAEQRVRTFVQGHAAEGAVLVVPLRLAGFGPYGNVLAGLAYRADSTGLLPHPLVTEWLRATAWEVMCKARWRTGDRCATAPSSGVRRPIGPVLPGHS